MRGLAGIIYPDVFQMNHLITPMLSTLKHRGEEEKDTYIYKNIELGVCGGKLFRDEKEIIITAIDGIIYNVDEVRAELKKKGFRFRTDQTEEVLAHAYDSWGPSFFQHLHGDFAIVIFDKTIGKVFLGRDRIGKKPLYWYQGNNQFIFASELKALIATGSIPQTPAPDALAMYLYFGFIPQDMSPIKGISKLLPGYYLEMHTDRSVHIENYWSFSEVFEKKDHLRTTNAVEEFDRRLNESTAIRIPNQKPIGCLLSGGLGSASIAYCLQKNAPPETVRAYSCGFLGENDSDILAAKDVTTTLKIPHTCGFVTRDNFLDNLVKIAWHLDEPIADPHIVSIWKLAELASQDTQTVFSGMGTDELLALHSRYTAKERQISPLAKLALIPQPLLRSIIAPLLHYFHKPWGYEVLRHMRRDPLQFEYLSQTALMNEATLKEASPRLSALFDPEVFLHKFYHLERIKSKTSSIMYFDIKTRLADHYILEYERLTSAHSLEWCTPYLDKDVVEFLAAIPEPDSLTEREAGLLLKSLLQPLLPPRFVNRPKRTRKRFLKSWIEAPQIVEIFKLLLKGTLVDTGYISKSWVEEQLSHIATSNTAFRHLWAVLMLEIWFKLYINHSIQTHPPTLTLQELLLEI